jgi:hypothetical protein
MLDHMLEILNRAVKADANAMANLINHRVRCNQALADDPTIQVGRSPSIGVMGLLSGIAGCHEDGFSKICAVYETVCAVHGVVEAKVGGDCGKGCKQNVQLGRLLGFRRTRRVAPWWKFWNRQWE